jgi:ABC-type nitrate/sulfonate/bicarbonate transport system substrate-binding protein
MKTMKNRMTTLSMGGLVVAAWLAAPVASAHHSGAMFDEGKLVKYQGTVKTWQWSNPHSFLYLLIKDAAGKEVSYQFETGSPNTMFRNGWRKDTFKPGDKVGIYAYPLRQGVGGMMVTARSARGEALQWLPASATAKAVVVE